MLPDTASMVNLPRGRTAEVFSSELAQVLNPLPVTLSGESINRGLVCACVHTIARTEKLLTFISY